MKDILTNSYDNSVLLMTSLKTINLIKDVNHSAVLDDNSHNLATFIIISSDFKDSAQYRVNFQNSRSIVWMIFKLNNWSLSHLVRLNWQNMKQAQIGSNLLSSKHRLFAKQELIGTPFLHQVCQLQRELHRAKHERNSLTNWSRAMNITERLKGHLFIFVSIQFLLVLTTHWEY